MDGWMDTYIYVIARADRLIVLGPRNDGSASG